MMKKTDLKKELRFRSNGEFHILMISDLHAGPKYNTKLKTAIRALLEETKPDLVLINGDLSVGGMYEGGVCTQEGLRSFLIDVMEDIETADIPWAHVYGNHDRESGLDLEKQHEVYEERPYCLSTHGPKDIHGVGNYVLPILSHDGERIAYNIWGLDSLREFTDYQEAFHMPGCEFRLPNSFGDGGVNASPVTDQVMWYYNTSMEMERENGAKIPAIMYMHVPLLEMHLISRNRELCNFEGRKREEICSSEMNSGLFMACLQRGDVKGMFFGHEHLNDFSGELFGMTMAYDGALGYDMSAMDDMRGGREIILYENPEKKLQTRQIRLVELMGDSALRVTKSDKDDKDANGDKYSRLSDLFIDNFIYPPEECKDYMNEWGASQGLALYQLSQVYGGTRWQRVINYLLKWYDEHISAGLPEKNSDTLGPLLALTYLYEETENDSYLQICKEWLDYVLHEMPRTKEGGFAYVTEASKNTDRLQMETLFTTVLFVARMGVVLRDDSLVQESIRQFLIHIKYLADPVTGLFYHGWSFEEKNYLAGALWGRGNAWYMIALVDYLEMVKLPAGVRDILISTLQRQAEALEKYQDADGMWHTLLDHPESSYAEASATGGICYGMVKARRKGMIDLRYGKAVERAWRAIEERIDENGLLREVSVKTPVGMTLDDYRTIPKAPQAHGQIMVTFLFGELGRHDCNLLTKGEL